MERRRTIRPATSRRRWVARGPCKNVKDPSDRMPRRGAGHGNVFQAIEWSVVVGSHARSGCFCLVPSPLVGEGIRSRQHQADQVSEGMVRRELFGTASFETMGSLEVPGRKIGRGLVQTRGRAWGSAVSYP